MDDGHGGHQEAPHVQNGDPLELSARGPGESLKPYLYRDVPKNVRFLGTTSAQLTRVGHPNLRVEATGPAQKVWNLSIFLDPQAI